MKNLTHFIPAAAFALAALLGACSGGDVSRYAPGGGGSASSGASQRVAPTIPPPTRVPPPTVEPLVVAARSAWGSASSAPAYSAPSSAASATAEAQPFSGQCSIANLEACSALEKLALFGSAGGIAFVIIVVPFLPKSPRRLERTVSAAASHPEFFYHPRQYTEATPPHKGGK